NRRITTTSLEIQLKLKNRYGVQRTLTIIEHCQKELARFKVPKDVVITEIPKTSTGKLQKFILREWAKERA
ncbi:hypothetical protein ABTA39_10385, partial [Acinetobacter baumannii]